MPLLAVAVVASCGSEASPTVKRPRLPHALASHWRAQADAVAAALAAHDGCLAQRRAVALRTSVIDAVNARRISPKFQEPLLSAVNDLSARTACIRVAAPPRHEKHHGHEKHHKHGHEGDD